MAPPEAVVRAFCAAMATLDPDQVRPYLAEAIHFRDPGGDAHGVEATLDAFAPVFRLFSGLELHILHLASTGNVVFTERTDRVTIKGVTTAVPALALFEVDAAGKLVRWYDYFDNRQVAALMRSDQDSD